ncbi:MAG: helix-turn-helix transcriptional regulator [Gemmatimonadota bacterium]|nr:helix-turn-helix transcriptional regulator [Gemmatimonadota bacterium]
MARYETLHRHDGVTIQVWRCRGHGSEEEKGALCREHTFAFPLRGAFRAHVGTRKGAATPGTGFYLRRGQEYRTSHPVQGGDGGVVFRIGESRLEEILRELDRPRPEPVVETILPTRSALRLRRLLATARTDPDPSLDLEESVLLLVGRMVAAGRSSGRGRAVRRDTERARRRAVTRVLEICAERFREPLSLEEIAREAAYSRYHLSRIFKRRTGTTIHRHLNRLRLGAALEHPDALGHLGRLALELGFSSHSHFTNAFRREFGAPPSRVLASLASEPRA